MHLQQDQEATLAAIAQEISDCRRCPRLVAWRESVAQEKVKRFAEEAYWGRGVPSFGDFRARLLITGLAPAAHGANRTGRMFTGDRSGDWLYRALHRVGFANQPTSVHAEDGLVLTDCYITATAHCAPPENKLLAEEIGQCRPYLLQEIESMPQIRVVVALGKIAFDAMWQERDRFRDGTEPAAREKRPTFSHGAEVAISQKVTLIASFHPSQQNTFTGRLTEPMLDAVFHRAREILDER
jgi:uracil-DNA glycosylase family 4